MNKEEIFGILEEANASETEEYLEAILNRKRELYPDWDIYYMAMPKESEEDALEFDNQLSELMMIDTLNIFYKFIARRKKRALERMAQGETHWDRCLDLEIMKEIMEEDWKTIGTGVED